MAVFSEPTKWDHPLGNNADVATLPDDTAGSTGRASLQKLFQLINQTPLEAGGIAPEREDFNALFKILGDSIFYMQTGGVWSYSTIFDYPEGALVSYGGYFYKCVQGNGPASDLVTPGTDTAYWQRLVVESEIAGIRMPIGMSVEWNSPELPDNGLWENGAEYDQGDYASLHNVIGYIFGSTTATKANCSLGEAFVAGAAGNNLRITVASSGASFLVSTYRSGTLVDQQLVTAATELKNTFYVTWDTSATLTNGTDVTMTGGADGTSFKVPNKVGKYPRIADNLYPLGADIAEQLPNITGGVGRTGTGAENGALNIYSTDPQNGALKGANFYGLSLSSYSGAGCAKRLEVDASLSNSIYTDNGLILPKSISKQSYIIYK